YHGTLLQHFESIRERILIDREDAKQFLDFGKGFYTTTNLEQANERAGKLQEHERDTQTGLLQRKHRGIVIAFDFLSAALYTIPKDQYKWFSAADRDWAEFIVNNRVQQTPHYEHGCLWTYGPMADGHTTKMCHAYFDGEIDVDMLLNGYTVSHGIRARGIRPYQDAYDQLAFHSESLANSVLLNARIIQYASHSKRPTKQRR
ncbi:MAG: DUF3990 domain-containing protein, partial [Tumebacillaceae bacterium]